MIRKLLFLIVFIGIAFNVNAQQYPTGLIFDDEAYEETFLTAPLMRGDYGDLPSKASLKEYTPIPGNQNPFGTCVAWATAYAARTISFAIQNDLNDRKIITENAFSPSFIYRQIKHADDDSCSKGSSLSDALQLIEDQGVPKLADFPYECHKVIREHHKNKAIQYKIDGFKRLFNKTAAEKVTAIKKSLSENKPVVFGMYCPQSFHDATDVWNPSDDEYTRDYDGGHAMAVIGYDDIRYGGAFEIMNSWDTHWGNEGFIWISYNDFNHFCKYAFELIEETPFDFSGELTFRLSLGDEMKAKFNGDHYLMEEAYSSGTMFQLIISNNEPAYVYAFGSDTTGKSYRIFPHYDGISPYLGYRQNNVAIPDEEHFIEMDETTGTDYFCVLYSNMELDFADIMLQMEQEVGSFINRLHKVLGKDLVEQTNIHYGSDKISFTAKSVDKPIIPIIVIIKHID